LGSCKFWWTEKASSRVRRPKWAGWLARCDRLLWNLMGRGAQGQKKIPSLATQKSAKKSNSATRVALGNVVLSVISQMRDKIRVLRYDTCFCFIGKTRRFLGFDQFATNLWLKNDYNGIGRSGYTTSVGTNCTVARYRSGSAVRRLTGFTVILHSTCSEKGKLRVGIEGVVVCPTPTIWSSKSTVSCWRKSDFYDVND
jgi:hypothetical protein